MKPWAAIRISNSLQEYGLFGQRIGSSGIIYTPQDVHYEYNESVHKDQYIWLFDDEVTCDRFIEFANRWGDVSLLKVKSQSVIYREIGPMKKAIFNEKGLVPV